MPRKRFTNEQIASTLRQAGERYHGGQGLPIDFSRPGKPNNNAYIESLKRHLREECLNASWFLSLADDHERTEEWRATTTKIDLIQPWAA